MLPEDMEVDFNDREKIIDIINATKSDERVVEMIFVNGFDIEASAIAGAPCNAANKSKNTFVFIGETVKQKYHSTILTHEIGHILDNDCYQGDCDTDKKTHTMLFLSL